MEFRTEIPINKVHNLINYNSDLVLLGSCFTENIGEKLNYFKFKTFTNPYGILFNPLAIEKTITESINLKHYTKDDLYSFNELWLSFNHHSKFSSAKPDEVLNNINKNISLSNEFLKNSTHVIITLGTAWVYRFLERDITVANCHKIPQKKFVKELLSVDEIFESLDASITLLKEYNKNVQIIITVSPVRHLKDGFIKNQQSKAHLITAVHQIVERKRKVEYFPAYEIVMDDLRDYRFYADDMVHPNSLTTAYIWKKFTEAWIDNSVLEDMEEINSIQKNLAHKPFHPKSEKHQEFLKKLTNRIAVLKEKYPSISF